MRSTTFLVAALIAGAGCARDVRTAPSSRLPAEARLCEVALQSTERARVAFVGQQMAQAMRELQAPVPEARGPAPDGVQQTPLVVAMAAPALPKPKPRKVEPPPSAPQPPPTEPAPEGQAPVAGEPAPPAPRPAPAVRPAPRRVAPPIVPAPPPPRDDLLPSTPAAVSAVVGLGGLAMGGMAVGIGDGPPSYPLMAVGLGIAGAGFLTAGILYIGERTAAPTRVAVAPGAVSVSGAF
jgi:hypothetical protein